MTLKIANREIGLKSKPFLIAEMSGNHNQSLDRALEIVTAAAESGVAAIKLQTFTAGSLTIPSNKADFRISSKDSLWYGKTLYQLYETAATPLEWHGELMRRANELDLICFSTPFDEEAVDFLERFDPPAYKIASFENNHLPLLRKVASTRKPLIISVGMASVGEIEEMIETIVKAGCESYVLMKCTSTYPASPESSNIMTIPHMRAMFNCEVGLSDHTLGIGASIAAVAHGATVIEKHFTLSRDEGGVDAAFSLEKGEMSSLATEMRTAYDALGKITYGPTTSEKESTIFRRSLYIVSDLDEGDVLTETNLRIIRPGFGLSPKHYELVLGRVVNRKVARGTRLSWELIS